MTLKKKTHASEARAMNSTEFQEWARNNLAIGKTNDDKGVTQNEFETLWMKKKVVQRQLRFSHEIGEQTLHPEFEDVQIRYEDGTSVTLRGFLPF